MFTTCPRRGGRFFSRLLEFDVTGMLVENKATIIRAVKKAAAQRDDGSLVDVVNMDAAVAKLLGIQLEAMSLDDIYYVKKVFNHVDPKALPRKQRSEIQSIFNMVAAVGAVKLFCLKNGGFGGRRRKRERKGKRETERCGTCK